MSMDQIKEELSGYAMELAPSDLPPNSQVKTFFFNFDKLDLDYTKTS